MSDNITECECLNKKTTQYIDRNIRPKFIDLIKELCDKKVPIQQVGRGLALALVTLLFRTTEVQNCDQKTGELVDDVATLLEKYQKDGVTFPCQAAALALCIPPVLGISYDDLFSIS